MSEVYKRLFYVSLVVLFCVAISQSSAASTKLTLESRVAQLEKRMATVEKLSVNLAKAFAHLESTTRK